MKRTDLLTQSVIDALTSWKDKDFIEEILVAEINPEFAEGKVLCNQYGISENDGANCVIVEGKRNSTIKYAACLASVNCVRTQLRFPSMNEVYLFVLTIHTIMV